MATTPRKPGRFRNFLGRIRNFLTPGQFRKVQATARKEGLPSKPSGPAVQPGPAPTPTTSEPRRATAGATEPRQPPGPVVRGRTEIEEEQKRIAQLRKIELEAREERERLEVKNAAQLPPISGLENFRSRKGFNYSTWFKAFGTFGSLKDMGDSPALLGEMEELEDFDVPSAFYSSTILGKVKWNGEVERSSLIGELNRKASWNPQDFRDIYPEWQYRYYVAEMVGDVVVQIFEHKAKQPLTRRDRENGFKAA